MDSTPYLPPGARARGRGGWRGRPVVVPVTESQQQVMMPRGGGRGYYVPPSPQEYQGGGGPLTSPVSRLKQGNGEGNSGYPAFGQGDFVKQLQFKIATLEHQKMCSDADADNLRVALDKRTKEYTGLQEKYAKLEEDYDTIASYAAAATNGGNGGDEKDQHFAQKCAKLEAKIHKNKAISADKEKIKELEEMMRKLEEEKGKLEGEKKKLEENVQQQEIDLEIQRSLNVRFHGMFKMFAEVASDNCKEIDSFVRGLGEGGIMPLEEVEEASPVPQLREEIGGGGDGDRVAFIVGSPSVRSSNSDVFQIRRRRGESGGGGGSVLGGGGGALRAYEDIGSDDEPPPPAAFLDAINNLTQEDLEELERMEMEILNEANK